MNAVRDHDAREVAASFFVDSPDDQKNLDWLLDKVRSSDANFRIKPPAQISKPSVRDADANSDVVFTFVWSANGRNVEKRARFHAHAKKSGDAWTIGTIQAVDRLE
jgi:hypothetical protein